MSEYENDEFEAEEPTPAPQQHPQTATAQSEKPHSIRLSIDLRSVRQFQAPATFCAFYDLKLSPQLLFSFKSQSTTVRNLKAPVNIAQGFAEFPFVLTKSDLFFVINEAQLSVTFGQQASDGSCSSSIGQAVLGLESVLRSQFKKTAHSFVRVCDMWLPIKEQSGSKIGEARIIVYLEDLGEAKDSAPLPTTVTMRSLQPPKQNKHPNKEGEGPEYSAVFELEVWKRAEMEKHKAYLREKESELRAEIAQQFQAKWMDKEKRFQQLLNDLASLEGRTKQKSLDLARRENRILQAEDELKRRQQEAAQKLVQSQEAIMNIKKKFAGERSDFEMEKKNLLRKVKEKEVAFEENQIKLMAMRRELEESPVSRLSVSNKLKNQTELAKKSLEIERLSHENEELKTSREQMRKQLEKAKFEYLALRRQQEIAQKKALEAKSAQLNKLQEEMRAMKEANQERRELERAKQQLMMLQRSMQPASNYTPGATQRPTGITGISGHPQQDTSHLGRETPIGQYYGQSAGQGAQFDRSSLTGPAFVYGSTSNVDDSNVSKRGIEVGGGQVEGMSEGARNALKLRNELLSQGTYSNQDGIIRELNAKIAANQ